MLIVWLAAAASAAAPSFAQGSPQRNPRTDRAVFGVFEGPRINVYARRLGEAGSGAGELLISEEARQNVRPMSAISVRISPRGNLIAYRVLDSPHQERRPSGPLYVVDAHGRNRTQVADLVADFFWSPNGDRILYSRPGRTYSEGAGYSQAPPPRPLGSEWRLLNVMNGDEVVVARDEDHFLGLAAWQGDQIVFNELVVPPLYALAVYDLGERRILADADPSSMWAVRSFLDLGALIPSPSGRHALLVVAGDDGSSTVYEVNSKWRVERKLLSAPFCSFGIPLWNSDDEVFYQKGAGLSPCGSECCRPVICRYSLVTQTERVLLERCKGDETSSLLGLLPGKRLLISTFDSGPVPRYTLQTLHLDGSRPDTLYTSDREMMFVGWLP